MSITITAFNNGDHAAVFWRPDDNAVLTGCRGFALVRSRDGHKEVLHSFVGFDEGDTLPADAPWKWPLQRYMWWDYHVEEGQTVKYQVVPVIGTKDALTEAKHLASPWTPGVLITSQFTPHISAFFNKGVAATQWVSRGLASGEPGVALTTALKDVIVDVRSPLRNELGGLLKPAVLGVVNGAAGGQLYSALYELNDPELVPALLALGKSANVILANGAFSAAKPDENKVARDTLRNHVNLHDRMVTGAHFAHNKFAVVCDSDGAAHKVLTGSTNWTANGLCSQTNNGLIIEDDGVANRFLMQWGALEKAGNKFPATLAAENSKLAQFTVDDVTVTPWFAPTQDQEELVYARKLIANAKQAALFLFFNPGAYRAQAGEETLLQDILARLDSDLYIRGVVNQEIAEVTEGAPSPETAPVTLLGAEAPTPLSTAVLVPARIAEQYGAWEPETLGASMVMVHSKVVVLDPWGDHPVLMTGSHNLGVKASKENDDNLVILEGPAAAPLATAYAINIIAIYQGYRWNHYVTKGGAAAGGWNGLEDNETWQSGHLKGRNLDELKFWTSAPS